MNGVSGGDRLGVHLAGETVGELEYRRPGRYRFTYAPGLVGSRPEGSLVLSVSLPVRVKEFTASQAGPFFEGLLPEGAVRTTLAQSFGISEDNSFALLAEFGSECAGAVVILPSGETPEPPGGGSIRWLDDVALAKEIDQLHRHPLGVSPEDGVRLSLGGLQQKLVLTRDATGRLGQPLGGAPSTHILKPPQERFPDLVANEAFCLRVAHCVGLRAAKAEIIIKFGGESCLLIERFDRTFDGEGRILRIHQEDMCQALGRLPGEKYEADGGPTLPEIFRLLRDVGGPSAARDINTLLDAAVLNFVLGNSDAHGKNFALLYREDGFAELAPFYDIVSTNAYPDIVSRLAMSIGGVTEPSEVGPGDWERLAKTADLGRQALPRVREQAERIVRCARAEREAAKAEGWFKPIIDRIVAICEARERQMHE